MKDDVTLINEVMQRIPNKYMATIVASKRAKALNQGVRPLIRIEAKPTTIALNEIAAGYIEPGTDRIDRQLLIVESNHDEIVPTPEIIIDEISDEIEEAGLNIENDTEIIDDDDINYDDIDVDDSEDIVIDYDDDLNDDEEDLI